MRLEWRAERAATPLGAVFGAVLLVAAGLVALWTHLGLAFPACHFRRLSGFPCPGCGSTRMAQAVLRGDLIEALTWNPLVFGVLAGVALWAVASTATRVLGWPSLRIVLAPGEGRVLRVAAVVVLVAGWVYLIWRDA